MNAFIFFINNKAFESRIKIFIFQNRLEKDNSGQVRTLLQLTGLAL